LAKIAYLDETILAKIDLLPDGVDRLRKKSRTSSGG
jgi:hypothetical protein